MDGQDLLILFQMHILIFQMYILIFPMYILLFQMYILLFQMYILILSSQDDIATEAEGLGDGFIISQSARDDHCCQTR